MARFHFQVLQRVKGMTCCVTRDRSARRSHNEAHSLLLSNWNDCRSMVMGDASTALRSSLATAQGDPSSYTTSSPARPQDRRVMQRHPGILGPLVVFLSIGAIGALAQERSLSNEEFERLMSRMTGTWELNVEKSRFLV